VRERKRPPVSAEEGAAAVRLAGQIVDSIKSHRWDGPASDRTGLAADIFAPGNA
jgi:hypothetical protein